MKALFLLSLLFLSMLTLAQKPVVERSSKKTNNHVFGKVELESGPESAELWKRHIRSASDIPDSIASKIPAGTYTIVVNFMVDVHGSIGQVHVKEDANPILTKTAIAAVRSYKGIWRSASQCGRLVNSSQKQAITFVIH